MVSGLRGQDLSFRDRDWGVEFVQGLSRVGSGLILGIFRVDTGFDK